MNPLRLLRHAATVAAAAGLLAASATDAHATHFRYGTIKYEITAINTDDTFNIKVITESAWRRSFYGAPNVGQMLNTQQSLQVQSIGGTFNQLQPLQILITSIDGSAGEDWLVGTSTHVFNNIPKSQIPLRIFWFGNARISTLQDGNNDLSFRVEARLTTLTNTFSPSSSLLPIVTVAHGQPAAHFFIPAADADGDSLTWSISPTSRSSLAKAAPDGFPDGPTTLSINPTTGEVTWNTAAERTPGPGTELYSVQFLVTDSRGSEIPVDALLRIVPNTSRPPVALIDGSPDPATFTVNPGTPVSFTLTGTDPDNDVVTLTSGTLPPGSTMTPTLPFAGVQPRSSVFNWTPTVGNSGSHVISYAVTDSFAMQDTTSVTIIVRDNFQPTVTCPVDMIIEATGPAGATFTAATTVNDPDGDALTVKWFVDNVLQETDNVPANNGATPEDFTFGYSIAAHPLRLEVDDGITQTRVCNATITVQDTIGPVITVVPDPQTIEATGPAGAVATYTATAVDVVDGPRPVNCTPASGSTFPLGATLGTCTSADTRGNTSTRNFVVNVVDTTAPVITVVPDPQTIEATGPTGAVATYTATAVDIVDGPRPVNCTPASGSTFPLGTTVGNCTASDTHGNSASQNFTVIVVDTTAPVITVVPDPQTIEATGPTGAVATYTATAVDIVDGPRPVSCTPSSGSTFPLGTTVGTCTSSDLHGNTSQKDFTVNVVDTTGPAITVVPDPQTIEATGPTGAVATYTATAVDIVDGPRPVSCTPASGSTFPLGTTTGNCTSADTRGNSSQRNFTVNVVDTRGPVITVVPDPQTIEATGPGGAVANFTATAVDVVDGPRPVTCTPASGSTFPLGTTTGNCTSADTRGNTSDKSYTVNVVDTTPPVLTLPANMTVPSTGPGGAVVNFTATAVDIVDGNVLVICVPPSGSLFPLGTTTVNCHATDAHNNRADGSFTITVVDLTPPPVVVTLSPGVLWPPNHKMVKILVSVQTEPGATCSIVNVTSNEPVEGDGDGNTAFDWIFSGMNLQLRAERSGTGTGRIYTVTVRCLDAAGNAGFGTATAICPHDMGGSSTR